MKQQFLKRRNSKTTKEDKDWYSYKDKRWANAETKDGESVGMDTKVCI